jgi:hypothetical protein
MEAVGFPELSDDTYQTTWRNIPEKSRFSSLARLQKHAAEPQSEVNEYSPHPHCFYEIHFSIILQSMSKFCK